MRISRCDQFRDLLLDRGFENLRGTLLPVTEDDDDGVIGVDEDLDVRTAPLGVMSGAVVGVVTGCPSC